MIKAYSNWQTKTYILNFLKFPARALLFRIISLNLGTEPVQVDSIWDKIQFSTFSAG